jgi:hypothetical protein
MASSRKVATNENISTYDSGGGADYSSLASWEGATDIDLVSAAQSEVLEVRAGLHTDVVTLNGATANSSYFRIIRPEAGAGHVGIPDFGGSVAAFQRTSGNGGVFSIADDYHQVQDVCARHTVNLATDWYTLVLSSCDQAAFVGVLCAGSVNAGSGIAYDFRGVAGSGNEGFVINCLSLDCEDDGFRGLTGTHILYNCNAIDSGADGFTRGTGTMTCKNCLADGNASNDFSGTIGGNNNASGDASAAGTGPRINQTFSFVATGSDDYHLASDDGGALDFGADLSADGSYAFDDDIDFETRSDPWDIGLDEFVSLIGYPIITDGMVSSLIFGRIVR